MRERDAREKDEREICERDEREREIMVLLDIEVIIFSNQSIV